MNQRVIEAIENMKEYKLCFIKFISANDSGETGGHQDGIYIPKNSFSILFSKPGIKGTNKEKFVDIRWSSGKVSSSRFIYYGKGTRNEYRITRLGINLKKDHLFVLLKNENRYAAYIFNNKEAGLFLNAISVKSSDTNRLFDIESLIRNVKPERETETEEIKTEEGIYHIRPAGRHILTIGSDLIQDKYAAVVELVKNSYDADASFVKLTFKLSDNLDKMILSVKDDGHGMSKNIVVKKWLVPSTDDKLKRKKSPEGRLMQGRKGVGRYAASILGSDLTLITCDGKNTTKVFLDWKKFENSEYLSDVKIRVDEKEDTFSSKGTELLITGQRDELYEWKEDDFSKLEFELKKLISPVEVINKSEKTFVISLCFENYWEDDNFNVSKDIEPYPIFDLYDYRISGKILRTGVGGLTYVNQKAKNTYEEVIQYKGKKTDCGDIAFDIRIFDREKEAIEELIKRGLKDEQGDYLGKLQARQLLNKYNGIGVYRNGFRIRPLGDPDFDWLKLNESRVQNPSMRIGSNQVIGYVLIKSEEESGLQEKSARDGLKDNKHYERLKEITKEIIGLLEERRFSYRKKAGLSRTILKTEESLERLFSFEDVKDGIQNALKKTGVDKETTNEIVKILEKKEEVNNRLAEQLKETVAIYQGQATLGKIMNVVLHEGRRPLNFFKNQIPNINFWTDEFLKSNDAESLQEITKIAKGLGINSEVLVNLFDRIDPLAAGKRGKKKEHNLSKLLNNVLNVFESTTIKNKIQVKIECPKDLMIECYPQDIYIILANLIDNSIFWIKQKGYDQKIISIIVKVDGSIFSYLDYKDTGPGIEDNLIESEVIFDPEFSTKEGGTGLGLAIAGEAATRNGLELKAFSSETGAYFRIERK